MNERYQIAKQLREQGKTLRQIGGALGVTHERARQMLAKVKRMERAAEAGPNWYDGLPTMVQNALLSEELTSEAQVAVAIDTPEFERIPNIGKIGRAQIRAWLARHNA